MRRREFLGLVGGAAAWPVVARGQQNGRMYRLAVLMPYAENDPEARIEFNSFMQGLQALGWSEGRNLRTDTRWAGNEPGRIPVLAKELVGLQPDAIFAMTTPAVNAVLSVSRTIPTAFTQVTDPVAQGMVQSLARPGGNITGVTIFEPEIGGKWVQMLKEIAPTTTRAAVIFNPDTAPYHRLYMRSVEAAALALGMHVQEMQVRSRAEVEAAVAAFAGEPGSGLITLSDGFGLGQRDSIIAAAARNQLPAAYPFRAQVFDGGLISYGVELTHMQVRAAALIDRILKGAKPAELPVELPTKFELVINLKTAKALGLDIPLTLLTRADEVIE